MKTKEEILEQETNEVEDSFMLGNGVDFFDGKCSSVLKAMDEWAKQVAIDFLEWGTSRNIKISPGIVVDDDSMCGSIEEYYDLYLKTKSNE